MLSQLRLLIGGLAIASLFGSTVFAQIGPTSANDRATSQNQSPNPKNPTKPPKVNTGIGSPDTPTDSILNEGSPPIGAEASSQQNAPAIQAGATGNFGFSGGSLQTLRLSDLLNKDITLQGGQAVGTVSDVVLNQNGSILYLLGTNATNQQMFTIPAQAASFTIDNFALTLPFTAEQFQALPTFSSTTIPNFNSVAYQRSLYTAYGLAGRNLSQGSGRNPAAGTGSGRNAASTSTATGKAGIQAGRVGDTVVPEADSDQRGSITGTSSPNPNRSTETRKPPLDQPALENIPKKELGIGNAVNNPLKTPEGKPLPNTLPPNAKAGTNGLPGGPKPNPVGPPKGVKPNPPTPAGGATGGTGTAPGPINGTTQPLRKP